MSSAVGPLAHEVAPLPAEGLPGDQRTGSARSGVDGRLDRALVRHAVAQGEGLVGRLHQLIGHHAAEQECGADGDHDPADRPGGALADPPVEQDGQPAVEAVDRARDGDQDDEHERGGRRDDEQRERTVRGGVHQVPDPPLPVAAEDRRRDERDHRDPGEDSHERRRVRPGVPVGEGPPDVGGHHPDRVAERGGDAADQSLGQPGPGEQGRGERHAEEHQRPRQAGQRVAERPPARPAQDGPPAALRVARAGYGSIRRDRGLVHPAHAPRAAARWAPVRARGPPRSSAVGRAPRSAGSGGRRRSGRPARRGPGGPARGPAPTATGTSPNRPR